MKKIYFLKCSFLLLFMVMCSLAMAQSNTVTGRIIDEENQPLPGATVAVKGTTRAAATDVNGYFKLVNAPSGPQVLVVRYIGYVPLEQAVTINGNVNVNMQLKSTSVLINEVAVIGYGVVKKA